MPQKSSNEATWTIVKWVLIAGIVCVPIVGWVVWGETIRVYMRNSDAEKVFGAQLQDYFSQGEPVINESKGFESRREAKSRIGKALWVNVKVIPRSNRYDHEFKIDSVMGALPDEVRAANTAEIDTLVLAYPNAYRNNDAAFVKTLELESGNTTSKISMAMEYWVEVLDVHVIDLKKKQYLGSKKFVWHPTQEMIQKSASHIPERQDEEVLAWFMGLPAK